MFDFLVGIGVLGVIATTILLLFLPLIVTIIVGTAIATQLGFTGVVWWAFVILFYLVIGSLLGMGVRK